MTKIITVLHPFLSSFVRRDIDILSHEYIVNELCIPSFGRPRKIPIQILKIISSVLISDIVICWFADTPSLVAVFFCRLFKKTAIIIPVGYEVAYVPTISYGLSLKKLGRIIVSLVLKNADKVFAVSNFSRESAIKNIGVKSMKIQTIYHGFPITSKGDVKRNEKHNLVITVGFVNWKNTKLKGLELFVKTAKYLPETKFILLGDWQDTSINYLKSIASDNVDFKEVGGRVELLNKYYQEAKIYVQVSIHESFGCALGEAMLWECIPVVSKVGALPEVVGNTGFYIDHFTPEELAKQILLAIQKGDGTHARSRIVEKFSLRKRQNKLLNIIKEIK